MTYASDQLYNEVIRKNLAVYSSTIKAREILPHLQCLTLTDREDVESKKGNYYAVQMLLENLRRRENWPEQFIAALRKCEHRNLADELSDAYDRIRGITNNVVAAVSPQSPASNSTAAATVTSAAIHTVPVTTPTLLTLPSVQAPSAPSSITAQVTSPADVHQLPKTQVVGHIKIPTTTPSPEIASQAPAVLPSVVPPPVVVSASKVTVSVQKIDPTQSEATDTKALILNTPDKTTNSDSNVIFTTSAEAFSSNIAERITATPKNSCQPKSDKDQVPLAVQETSEKHPIQDTNPALKPERSQVRKECSVPTANEIVQRINIADLPVIAQTTPIQTAQATPPAALPEVVPHHSSSISQEYFSKPGILQVPGEARSVSQEEPCSVDSNDLEISDMTECSAEHSLAEHHNTESLSSTNESLTRNLSLEAASNQPQEDSYESFNESQRGTLTNVILFAEEPSAENLNGQPPSMLGNTFSPGGVPANLRHSTVISENQYFLNHENTENVVHLRKLFGRDDIRASDHEKSIIVSSQKQKLNSTKSEQIEKRKDGTDQTLGQARLIAAAVSAAAVVGIGLFVVWKIKH